MGTYEDRINHIPLSASTGFLRKADSVIMDAALIPADADARIAALEAEVAALRGALPDARLLEDAGHLCIERGWPGAIGLVQSAAAIRALPATAPAAEPGANGAGAGTVVQ